MTRRPVNQERLLAAYQAGEFESWNKMAAKAGVAHTTLSRLLSGQIDRVNEPTLRRLVETLHVPGEWLTGEREDLPYVPQFGPSGLNDRAPSFWERPLADQVRHSWLMQGVETAIRRDLADWCGDRAGDTYDAWGRSLLTAFAKMASLPVWRVVALQTAREGSPAGLLQGNEAHTIQWLTHLLEPWIRGEAYLNAAHWRALFDAFAEGSDLFKDEIRDGDALRAFGKYAKLCDDAVQRRWEAEVGPSAAAEEEGGVWPSPAGPAGGGGARGGRKRVRRTGKGRRGGPRRKD